MVISDRINMTGRSRCSARTPTDRSPVPGPDRGMVAGPAGPPAPGGRRRGCRRREGVYVGLIGPKYQAPAEVWMLRTCGGDAVGMSTVLEAIAARWAGLEVCGVSLVTNAGAG